MIIIMQIVHSSQSLYSPGILNLTPLKLQQKQVHLFHTPDSILYGILKVPEKYPGGVLKSGNHHAPSFHNC